MRRLAHGEQHVRWFHGAAGTGRAAGDGEAAQVHGDHDCFAFDAVEPDVGSVGQPRDNDPRLSFGFFDSGEFIYKNVRIPYDIISASKKIQKEGLPELLASRILEGI